MKKRVLIISSSYLPGFRSGGPQRSVENIVDVFGDKSDIYILTKDHDMDSDIHYEGVANNKWLKVGKAHVMYVTDNEFDWSILKKAYFSFDTIFAGGLFDVGCRNLLLIHRLYHKAGKKVYIAPMGVFSSGAYNNKSHMKKAIFISMYKAIGAFKDVTWSLSTKGELKEAENVLGYKLKPVDYIIAEDFPQKVDFEFYRKKARNYIKAEKRLRLVFISRIPPQKNLNYALQILSKEYDGEIVYDVYGTIEDKTYWQECSRTIAKLPGNVKARYCGELKPDEVVETFSDYDAFLFPTKGENFGHVIYESLAAGCIPIISDQTPWKSNEKKSFYVIPLKDKEAYIHMVQDLLNISQGRIREKKLHCIDYAEESYKRIVEHSGYTRVFE